MEDKYFFELIPSPTFYKNCTQIWQFQRESGESDKYNISRMQRPASDDVVSRTIQTDKIYNFDTRNTCLYTNFEVYTRNDREDNQPIIRVQNTLCKQAGTVLFKTTEIRFKDKYILIQDQYRFGCDSQLANQNTASSIIIQTSEGSSNGNPPSEPVNPRPIHRKRLIFKKRPIQSHWRIKQNNVKSFCTAFLGYLEEHNQMQEVGICKQIVMRYNYNSKALQKLLKHKQLRQHLQQYSKINSHPTLQDPFPPSPTQKIHITPRSTPMPGSKMSKSGNNNRFSNPRAHQQISDVEI